MGVFGFLGLGFLVLRLAGLLWIVWFLWVFGFAVFYYLWFVGFGFADLYL